LDDLPAANPNLRNSENQVKRRIVVLFENNVRQTFSLSPGFDKLKLVGHSRAIRVATPLRPL